ncbi:MAG: flippase [Pyrinomonadaceae bacterium]
MAFSLFKNFLSLISAETFSKAVTFVAFAYLARSFGASGFGYIEWAGAVLMCASLIVDQGFSAYGTREIAKDPTRTAELVKEILTARFLFALIGYLVLALFAFGFTDDPVLRNLLLIYGLSLWMLPFLLQWVFQGYDRMNLVAVAQIIRQSVFVAVIFIFVRSISDLYFVGIAEIAGVSCAALFTVWIYRQKFAPQIDWRPRLSAQLFRQGLPIGLSQMFWTFKMFGATFIVGLVATAEDTGYFAGAMRIYIALHTFVWLYYANLLPSLSRGWERRDGSFSELIKNSMRLVLPLSLVGGFFWVLLSPVAMSLAYGSNFSNGSGPLQWLAGACVAAAISGHFRFGLIAAGFQNKEMWTSALGAAVAIGAIPFGYFQAGPSGAAAALFLAELIVLLTAGLISKRNLFDRSERDEPKSDLKDRTKNPLRSLTEAAR